MIYDFLKKTLVFILAGGQGERLYPLTRDRSKPAVHFGGIYRIIDFSLSNCLNSDLERVIVLTQYKSLSLDRHIKMAWNIYSKEFGKFIDAVPPQQRIDSNWYQGTADAIFQNIYIIEMEKPEIVVVLSGDHVYKMDYRKIIQYHIEKDSDCTLSVIETDCEDAKRFGVIEVDSENRVTGFEEKPENPKTVPGKENRSYISMGIYVFKTNKLVQYLSQDFRMEGSNDFGKDVIPRICSTERVFGYDYTGYEPGRSYWRDIGTLKSYYEANMDLVSIDPRLNLYDRDWPIRTYMEQWPPAKTVFDEGDRRGYAINSIISNGAIISGSKVSNTVVSPGVKINSYSEIQGSVIMHGVKIGRHTRIRNTIIDKGVIIPEKEEIGFNIERDRNRFTVTPEDIIVIPKYCVF